MKFSLPPFSKFIKKMIENFSDIKKSEFRDIKNERKKIVAGTCTKRKTLIVNKEG